VKLTAQAGQLATALQFVAIGVKRGGVDAVRIATADGEISLATSYMQLAIAAKAIATIIEPGHAATSADKLAALIGSLPAASVTAITATETAVAIACGNHRSRLPLLPWAELPPMIEISDEIGCVEISGADALVLLEPLPAAATEANRYNLRGIFWQTVGERLVSIATNGTRLIAVSIGAGAFSEGRDLIVPADAAAVLRRLIKSTRPATVVLRRSKSLVAATCGQFSFVSKLIDAQFPDVQRVIPPPSRSVATCKREHLIGALETLNIVALMSDEAPLLALDFGTEPALYINLAREPSNGIDVIDAETTGTGRAVVQLKLLLDMLNEIAGDKVRLEVSGDRPLQIIGDGSKIAVLAQCRWDFETEKRPASAR
jgi:DNA polymerase-3 subunit beta